MEGIVQSRREDRTMNFRLEELSGETGGLARGEALRRVGGFTEVEVTGIEGLNRRS